MRTENPAGQESLKALQRRGATVEHLERVLAKQRERREREIRIALEAGVPAAAVARAARLTAGRVSQIANPKTQQEDDGE